MREMRVLRKPSGEPRVEPLKDSEANTGKEICSKMATHSDNEPSGRAWSRGVKGQCGLMNLVEEGNIQE
jgi:hypothetical protein